MTNLAKWDRAMNAQVKQIKKAIAEKQRQVARTFYNKVSFLSPIYSGYYKGNHRVTFTEQVKLYPAERTPEYQAHIDLPQIAWEEAQRKLSSKNLPIVVRIGNAAPYAAKLEDPSGGGVTPVTGVRPVYANARALTIEKFKAGRG